MHGAVSVQGYLAHKKRPPPRTLQHDYTQGPMVALGEVAVSYERGTPVRERLRECGSECLSACVSRCEMYRVRVSHPEQGKVRVGECLKAGLRRA